MAAITHFEDIKAWQKARLLCKEIFDLISNTDLSKDYKLKDQINGSSGSAMDNIAEGFGRGGNLEFIQFLEIAHASACECQSQLYRIKDRNYINEEKFRMLYDLTEEVKKMILSFIYYLSGSNLRGPKYQLRENNKKAEG
jgi:four helix bundle protein